MVAFGVLLVRLLSEPLFIQCCMDAGVNPYDLFPTVADEVEGRAHTGSSSSSSRASIDVMLKEQVRPTVLAIGPDMLDNPHSRKKVRDRERAADSGWAEGPTG